MNNRMLNVLLFAYAGLFTGAVVTGHRIFLVAVVALTAGALSGIGLHHLALKRRARRQ